MGSENNSFQQMNCHSSALLANKKPFNNKFKSNINYYIVSYPRLIAFGLELHSFFIRKSEPLFKGYYQPGEPHDGIGYYDLSDVSVIKKQVGMAKKNGIEGFCFYHYWFHGNRLLEKPVGLFLNPLDLIFPFSFAGQMKLGAKNGMDMFIIYWSNVLFHLKMMSSSPSF